MAGDTFKQHHPSVINIISYPSIGSWLVKMLIYSVPQNHASKFHQIDFTLASKEVIHRGSWWESWPSGKGRGLMIWRSWVCIPTLDSILVLCNMICHCKIVLLFKVPNYIRWWQKEVGVWATFNNNKFYNLRAGALVQWLWEETFILKVVGSNPSTVNWMDILHFYLL